MLTILHILTDIHIAGWCSDFGDSASENLLSYSIRLQLPGPLTLIRLLCDRISMTWPAFLEVTCLQAEMKPQEAPPMWGLAINCIY